MLNPTATTTFQNRRADVSETGGASIAAWQFWGPARTAEVVLGNGLVCTWLNNARDGSAIQDGLSTPSWGNVSSDRLGYDGAGRAITKRYLAGGIDSGSDAYDDPTSVVGFTTAYDKASNKFFERHLHAESRSHLYEEIGALPPDEGGGTGPLGGYDSLDRLRQYQRGELASGGGSVTTPISLPNTDERREYVLDGVGNWRRNIFEPVGGSLTTEVRQHNSLNQIARYGATACTYDANGNLLDDGIRLYFWDALNRLATVKRKSDNEVIGTYTYDALNRRIRKIVSDGGLSGTIPDGTTDFLYLGWRCIEERDGSDDPTKQYVWGIYLDELLQQKHLVTINGKVAGVYYPLSDLLYRTAALTDSSGDIVETYDTDAYGNTLIFNAAGTGSDWWADDVTQTLVATCEFIFTGQRYDTESLACYFKERYYLSPLGRFLSRDLFLYGEAVNLAEYVNGQPSTKADPSGNVPVVPIVVVSGVVVAILVSAGCSGKPKPVAPVPPAAPVGCMTIAAYTSPKGPGSTYGQIGIPPGGAAASWSRGQIITGCMPACLTCNPKSASQCTSCMDECEKSYGISKPRLPREDKVAFAFKAKCLTLGEQE